MASIGIQIATFINARVAGQITFVPQHTNAQGKLISARADIPILVNSGSGDSERTDSYKLTAWGKLAVTCCKSLPVGKEISVVTRPQSFVGKLFNQDGSMRLDNMGQVIETKKTGYTILEIAFGGDSAKHIANEIQQGIRPADWNVQGTAGYNRWREILIARQSMQWDGNSQQFGYARVFVPQGARLDFSTPEQRRASGGAGAGYPGAQAGAGTSFHGMPAGNMSPENLVHQHFNPANTGGTPGYVNPNASGMAAGAAGSPRLF